MGQTVLPYLLATGGAVTDTDMTAVADAEFSARSGHFVFTNDFRLRWHMFTGATATRANINVPTWNAITKFNVWPVNLSSANVTSPPRVAWLEDAWPMIPRNEEYAVLATDGASENCAYVMGLFTPGHNSNIPANKGIIVARATASILQVAGKWSAPVALTMEQGLRGGIYSVIGAEVVGSGTFLFRLIFPRSRFYVGQRLRPGWLCQQAIGDLPEPRLQINPYYFGEWGRFHTFEMPQIEVWSIAGSSTITHEIRLWLAFIGEGSESGLDPWVQQGWN